jgi:hypothetical protein
MLSTRSWWTDAGTRYRLFTSQLVLNEAAQGDPLAAADRLAALAHLDLIPVLDVAEELAKFLVIRGALPPKARVDALHVAIAATNAVQYLATWNCRHLANAALRVKIQQACHDRGYNAPVICTPLELTEDWP